jgi:hypothetical protein
VNEIEIECPYCSYPVPQVVEDLGEVARVWCPACWGEFMVELDVLPWVR